MHDVVVDGWSRPWNLKVDDATYDRLVRNVYKVLLTRGLVGTLVYSVDAETQEMLRAFVDPR